MRESQPVPTRVQELAAQLAEPQAMRRGSLSERYVKCSKPGCACAKQPEERHGPYYSLTRTVAGRTQSRFVSAPQAEIVRHQVQAGRRFRRQVDTFWEACEAWADAQLETPQAASPEVVEKGGSKQPGKPKSPRKSKLS